ncbi:UDP-N-acetylmuramate dehydrogenase [Pseudolysobacter antarcticus]|uniref:UDP-N-acetylenolpyruvoylglucosamine reductase n=1 Tax=Pseudolysobacter antarcticus TaxID=2511995 RepID=A0A411HL92_9GAMM|nr:UDP-N-acetylmuramate dehydrogenase [Pseudolysobacter antarcticus]QBB71302.1 UDP-N-acetylmuramate dehydrogenase [Pseudolysobacter antarcticus]
MSSLPACGLQYDVSLKARNTFGVDARAAVLARVADIGALQTLLAQKQFANLPRLILGGGSNILFTRDFDGLVLLPEFRGMAITHESGDLVHVRAGAGESWDALVRWSLAQGLCGLENLALIPGHVGAAPIQNIGAYGIEFAEVCAAVEIHDVAIGTTRWLSREQCGFGYRHSIFKMPEAANWIVTAVDILLTRQAQLRLDYAGLREQLQAQNIDTPTAADVADAVTQLRLRKLPNPALIGNAGSFFKNPIVMNTVAKQLQLKHPTLPTWPTPDGLSKLSAAWLIESCGFKGLRDGDAGVSSQHALVLVNHGAASGAQLWALAQRIQASVRQHYDVLLLPEPMVI